MTREVFDFTRGLPHNTKLVRVVSDKKQLVKVAGGQNKDEGRRSQPCMAFSASVLALHTTKRWRMGWFIGQVVREFLR